MRKFVVVSLLAAPLLLAGCGSPSQNGGSSASASTSTGSSGMPVTAATVVTGTVKLQTPGTAIEPGAKLQLSLVDVTKQPGVTINQQNVDSPTFPQTFRIPFTAGQINGNDLYVLQATMQANGRTWSTKMQQPVLTHNQPAQVDLTLNPEPTPSEKVWAAFQTAKRQTGGMKVKSGTSSKIGEARSWQVFRDQHGIEFIITQLNQDKGGFTKTEYAYRNQLPWVVVQQQAPKQGAAVTSTVRVSWDDNGVVVLNQKEENGKQAGTVSDADTKSLHKQASDEYKKFAKQQH
ncbi:MAG: YbaY family lipoprotein [Rhodanobacteraceae bacterium]